MFLNNLENKNQCFQSTGFIRKSRHFPIWRRSFWNFFEKSGHFCVYWAAKNHPDPALTNRPDLLLSVNPWNDTSGYPNADIRTVSERDFFLRASRAQCLKKINMCNCFAMDRWVSQFFTSFCDTIFTAHIDQLLSKFKVTLALALESTLDHFLSPAVGNAMSRLRSVGHARWENGLTLFGDIFKFI